MKSFDLIDGLGVYRIINKIFNIENKVELITANLKDCIFIYDLQCEYGARKYSRNSSVPSFSEHKNWFNKSMSSDECDIYIIYFNEIACGYVRLDEGKGSHEVSIIVSKTFQKLGLAKSALIELKKIRYIKKINAFVMPENIASINLFKSSGFNSIGDNYYQWSKL